MIGQTQCWLGGGYMGPVNCENTETIARVA